MKKFDLLRVCFLFVSLMGILSILPGCGGEAGGGRWDKPPTIPAVSSTDPAHTATGVPLNNKISAIFSGTMDPSTINSSTFILQQGATAVAGTVTYSGVTAIFTPTSNLAPNTIYTATITTGAKDPAGKTLANNYVWSFTTSSTIDVSRPTISFTSPANGTTSVAFNQKISVAFSESMDPLTLTTASFLLTGPGTTPVTGTVTSAGSTATFTPSANLAASTLYTATITTGAKNLAGNALASNYVFTFRTGATPDTTNPVVSFTDPFNAVTGVAVNRKLNAAFSEAMDPLTITTATFTVAGPGLTPVPGTVSYIGTTATFTPSINLAASTLYTATITTGAKDVAGNALASNFVWSFTTSAAPDTIRPTVSFTDPINGATSVATNRKLNVAFSESMDPLTLTTASFTLTGPGATPVTGTVSAIGQTAVFSPASNLAANSVYTAVISTTAKDLAGNALASNYVWSFTTGSGADTTRPTVSVTSPTNTAVAVPVNRKITVGFSEVVDPLTLTVENFKLTGPGLTPVAGNVTSVGATATFVPLTNLATNTVYTATITTGVADLAGNTLANNFVFTFTTALTVDTTSPTVISTIPLNLATGVNVNQFVTAIFSEDMDPLTIATESFVLKETVSGATVPSAITYNVGSKTATLRQLNNLNFNTSYTATIKGGSFGVRDLADNTMTVDKVWSFTTGDAPETIRPTVILVNPLDLATNVALNSTINATFSEAMEPSSISTGSFTVAGVTGLVTYNAISRVATFTPSSNLAPGTTYTATVTTGVTDLAGNSMALNKVWSFTTGTALAPGAVALGSVGTYGIMATSAITNTGFSIINGDVSLDPGTSMTGFPPGVVNGSIHINDSFSAQARIDLLTAYNFAKSLPPGITIPAGADLGALYPTGIPPGTYTSGSTMLVSTPLTLDAGGNANAVWVFQIGSSFTTTASVSLANGAQAKNVFWVPTNDGTIGVGTIFYGTIVAGRSVTGVTGATINGRILAGAILAGTIALDTNTVNVPAP